MKMCILFLKYLKTHPGYAQFKSTNGQEIAKARTLCNNALKTAEVVKQQLRRVYAAEAEKARLQAEREEHERQVLGLFVIYRL